MAFAVGMGFQTTCGIVTEGFFAAVGIEGEGKVLVGVVMVFGVLSQRIGNARQLSFGGVGQTGFVTGAPMPWAIPSATTTTKPAA